jgi:hypothetical protein
MRNERFDKRGFGGFGGFERLGGFRGLHFSKLGSWPGFASARHPVTQFISLLVIGAAVVGVVLMGAFLQTFPIGAAVLASAVLAVRVWWFQRKLRAAARASTTSSDRGAGAGRVRAQESSEPCGRLIEAEYTIVAERDSRRRRTR